MNRNIEVINEHLWTVNMQYVKAGYIGGMKLNNTSVSDQIYLTNQGIIVIDKDCCISYPAFKMLFSKVMNKTTEELNELLAKGTRMKTPDKVDELLINVVGWEIKRRCVKGEYDASLTQPTFKDKIKNLIRKKVKIWV